MGFIPQITCRRCGTKFSGLRRRCPQCGTRRVQNSQRVPGATPSAVKGTAASARANDNRKWQMIFGIILVAAVIIALIVMVTVSLKGADEGNTPALPTTPPEVSAIPTPTPEPTPTPTPTPEITDLKIQYNGEDRVEFTMHVGEHIQLNGSHYPMTISADYQWSSQDQAVLTVDGSGLVTGVGIGTTNVVLTMYGKSVECRVYVRG